MVRRAWRVRRLCVGRCVRLVGAFHRPVGHAWRSSAAAQDRDSPSAFVFFLLLCLLGFLLVFSLHMGSAPVWRGGGGLSRRRSVESGGRPPRCGEPRLGRGRPGLWHSPVWLFLFSPTIKPDGVLSMGCRPTRGRGAGWGWLGPNGHRVLLPARLKR